MSSTEPYPEVSADESGIVPQQANRAPEWPKKIRTLTATELDRLTIDSAGRFYWDGKLVNYEGPQPMEPAKPEPAMGRMPLEAEPNVYRPEDQKSPEPIEGAELDRAADTQTQAIVHRDEQLPDLDEVRASPHHRAHHHGAMSGVAEVVATPMVNIPDRMRIKMTAWQSLGAIIVVLCAMGASIGVAALGLTAAHEWSCRAGVIKTYCPPVPSNRPPARADIPA